MYPGSGAKIAGVVRQVGLSAASKIMCYLLVMFLECWQAKVRHEQGMVECAIRSQFGRDFANVQHEMSALSALPPPPPLNYYTKKIRCARLRRPSLPTGGQRVQRGLAQPNACTTDIIPHSCTGMRQRPGRLGAVQNGGEFSATSGQPHGLRARRPRSQGRFPKYGLHPGRLAKPHLTDIRSGCTHNDPGFTSVGNCQDDLSPIRGPTEHRKGGAALFFVPPLFTEMRPATGIAAWFTQTRSACNAPTPKMVANCCPFAAFVAASM